MQLIIAETIIGQLTGNSASLTGLNDDCMALPLARCCSVYVALLDTDIHWPLRCHATTFDRPLYTLANSQQDMEMGSLMRFRISTPYRHRTMGTRTPLPNLQFDLHTEFPFNIQNWIIVTFRPCFIYENIKYSRIGCYIKCFIQIRLPKCLYTYFVTYTFLTRFLPNRCEGEEAAWNYVWFLNLIYHNNVYRYSYCLLYQFIWFG